MELLNINKTIVEQLPLLVTGCLSLKDKTIHPRQVELLLENSNFEGLDLDTVLDISNYASVVEFMGECKEQKFRTFSGTLVIALTNFILKKIAVKEGFIRDDIDIKAAIVKLDEIFAKQQGAALNKFIKGLSADLMKLKLLTVDNEVLVYIILNFYLYVYTNKILIFTQEEGAGFEELTQWVNSWKG